MHNLLIQFCIYFFLAIFETFISQLTNQKKAFHLNVALRHRQMSDDVTI